MHKVFLLGLIVLAGCQSTAGPFAPRSPQRVDDPRVSINEQESRGRDRLALPDDFSSRMPTSGMAIPSLGYQSSK